MAAQGTDVEDLGTEDVRGCRPAGRGGGHVRQMLEAQGLDADDCGSSSGSITAARRSDEDVDQRHRGLLGLEVPLEVWVDDAGRSCG